MLFVDGSVSCCLRIPGAQLAAAIYRILEDFATVRTKKLNNSGEITVSGAFVGH
jgi:hypothetical protein